MTLTLVLFGLKESTYLLSEVSVCIEQLDGVDVIARKVQKKKKKDHRGVYILAQ